jgi:hypothetical protein
MDFEWAGAAGMSSEATIDHSPAANGFAEIFWHVGIDQVRLEA